MRASTFLNCLMSDFRANKCVGYHQKEGCIESYGGEIFIIMEIDFILLGLIKLYKEVSGYELNRIIHDSNRYFIAVSLAYIYPVLKRLHQRGWVTFAATPIPNRPDKKSYHITPEGEKVLQDWLEAPIEPDMYFRSFLLKMQFAALMRQETVLNHIEREIYRLEEKIQDVKQLNKCIESGKLDAKSCEVLTFMTQLLYQTDELRIKWLKDWQARLTDSDRVQLPLNQAGLTGKYES